MREHIHAPAYNEGRSQDHRHEPRWDEPSRGAEGRAISEMTNAEFHRHDTNEAYHQRAQSLTKLSQEGAASIDTVKRFDAETD